jgi:hypothetical protein
VREARKIKKSAKDIKWGGSVEPNQTEHGSTGELQNTKGVLGHSFFTFFLKWIFSFSF